MIAVEVDLTWSKGSMMALNSVSTGAEYTNLAGVGAPPAAGAGLEAIRGKQYIHTYIRIHISLNFFHVVCMNANM